MRICRPYELMKARTVIVLDFGHDRITDGKTHEGRALTMSIGAKERKGLLFHR